MENKQIEAFFKKYDLGVPVTISKIAFGDSYDTYSVETTQKKYVAKIVDRRKIEKDKHFIEKFTIAEKIAYKAKEIGFNSIAAIDLGEGLLTSFDGNQIALYPFFYGDRIQLHQLTKDHRKKIGQQMALLHNLNLNVPEAKPATYGWERNEGKLSWKEVKESLGNDKPSWYDRFERTLHKLKNLTPIAKKHYESFQPQDVVISHGDIFPENTLWENNEPYFLDWEKARLIDSHYECINAAIRYGLYVYPDGYETEIKFENFLDVIEGYTKHRELKWDEIETYVYVILNLRIQYLQYFFYKYNQTTNEDEKNKYSDQINLYLKIVEAFAKIVNALPLLKKIAVESK